MIKSYHAEQAPHSTDSLLRVVEQYEYCRLCASATVTLWSENWTSVFVAYAIVQLDIYTHTLKRAGLSPSFPLPSRIGIHSPDSGYNCSLGTTRKSSHSVLDTNNRRCPTENIYITLIKISSFIVLLTVRTSMQR